MSAVPHKHLQRNMDLRIIINLLGFKLDGSHLNILSNKTGKKKNMDAEGQNRECDRLGLVWERGCGCVPKKFNFFFVKI